MAQRVIVIGGGAAGLMAAGRAAELGASVTLLEKNDRPGIKVRLTGGGRCNLTNNLAPRQFVAHLGPNGMFMRNALARFGPAELRAWFAAQGVPTVVEPDGRVFPASNSSRDVVEALQRYNAAHGVRAVYLSAVAEIIAAEGRARGVRLRDGATLEADAIVLATGGASYPTTGSSGDGYAMAQKLGHTITPLRPGLIPLVCAEPWVRRLQGVSLGAAGATLSQGERTLASGVGEMLFTHYGVSGPLILDLSSRLGAALDSGPVRLTLDMLPARPLETFDQLLQRDLAELGRARYMALLRRYLTQTVAEVLAEVSGIPAEQRLSELSAAQRRATADLLKRLGLTITATRPLQEAMVTLGGVRCDEVDPRTMASRRVEGLYLAGELLDVAGETGGYNLTIAFSTGRIAGENAAATH